MPVLRWTIGLKVMASLWGLPVSHGSNSRLRRAQAIDSHPHRWSTKKQQLFLPTSRRHCYSELMLTTQPQLKPQQHGILWWAYLEQPSSVGDACGSAGLPPKNGKNEKGGCAGRSDTTPRLFAHILIWRGEGATQRRRGMRDETVGIAPHFLHFFDDKPSACRTSGALVRICAYVCGLHRTSRPLEIGGSYDRRAGEEEGLLLANCSVDFCPRVSCCASPTSSSP